MNDSNNFAHLFLSSAKKKVRVREIHQIEKFYLYFFFSVKLMVRIHFDENLSAYTTGHHFVCQNQITLSAYFMLMVMMMA